MNTAALYTAAKITKKEKFTGALHGSTDGDITLCGQGIVYGWYIIDNTFTGKITCKKCLKILEEVPYHKINLETK